MKSKLVILTTLAMVFLLSLTACSSLGDVRDLGDQFMSALSTQDNATSYAMLSADIQSEVGGETGWAEWTSIRNFESWKFNSNSVENDEATLEGTALLDGEEYLVTLVFTRNGDVWELTTIVFE